MDLRKLRKFRRILEIRLVYFGEYRTYNRIVFIEDICKTDETKLVHRWTGTIARQNNDFNGCEFIDTKIKHVQSPL